MVYRISEGRQRHETDMRAGTIIATAEKAPGGVPLIPALWVDLVVRRTLRGPSRIGAMFEKSCVNYMKIISLFREKTRQRIEWLVWHMVSGNAMQTARGDMSGLGKSNRL